MKLFRFLASLSIHAYILFDKLMRTLKLRNKIKRYISTNDSEKLDKDQNALVKNYFREEYGIKNVDTRWHRFLTSSNGQFSTGYLPEDLFYLQLEPQLNDRDLSYAFGDKNILDRLFPMAKQPETIVKCINGFFYADGIMCSRTEAIGHCASEPRPMVIKLALGSYGGKGVTKFSVTDGNVLPNRITLEKLFTDYGDNFIVQKAIVQHDAMSALNQSSLNTFRAISYLDQNGVAILSIYVRMGRKGSLIDNASQGGLTCGIQKNGQLNKRGYMLDGSKCFATDSGQPFSDIKLPFMDKIYDSARTLHKQAPHFRLISWDFCLDMHGDVVLIEYNIQGQDINMHQLNNGPILRPVQRNIAKNDLKTS